LLNVKHSVTTAYHPQTNAQVERFNQTVAKYLASFVDSTTLDWELYLAPLAFSYNTSLHRTTKATPYSLTYGAEARAPSFPNPDVQRRYGESQPSEWFQRLQQARELAMHHSSQTMQKSEDDFNKKAIPFKYTVDQLVWLSEQNFLARNRKLAPKWTGPFKIVKIFDFGVVDIEHKRKIYRVNMDRIKPYTAEFVQQHDPTTQVTTPRLPVLQQQHDTQKEDVGQREELRQNVDQHFMQDNERREDFNAVHPPRQREVGERPQQPREEEPQQPLAQEIPRRGRGRPRKQQAAPPPVREEEREEMRERGGEAEEGDGAIPSPTRTRNIHTPVLQERRPARLESQERPITRSMTKEAMTRPYSEGGLAAVSHRQMEREREYWRQWHWRQAVGEGPLYDCDEFGLPTSQTGTQEPQWVFKRRQALRKLSVEQRNTALTGDSAFQFDPIPYEVNWQFQRQEVQEVPDAQIEEEEDEIEVEEAEEVEIEIPVPEITPPTTPEGRRRRDEAQLLHPTTPEENIFTRTLRSGKTYRSPPPPPPPPGTTPRSAPWRRTMMTDSSLPTSSSSLPATGWGARSKQWAKDMMMVPPSPGGRASSLERCRLQEEGRQRERVEAQARLQEQIVRETGPMARSTRTPRTPPQSMFQARIPTLQGRIQPTTGPRPTRGQRPTGTQEPTTESEPDEEQTRARSRKTLRTPPK